MNAAHSPRDYLANLLGELAAEFPNAPLLVVNFTQHVLTAPLATPEALRLFADGLDAAIYGVPYCAWRHDTARLAARLRGAAQRLAAEAAPRAASPEAAAP